MYVADFEFCVNEALKAKAISKDNADFILNSENPQQAIEELALNLSQKRKDKMSQAIAINKAYKNMMSIEDKAEGLMALQVKSEYANFENVEKTAQGIAALHHAKNADMLSAFRTKTLGLTQDKEGLKKLVKHLKGEKIDDAAIRKYGDGLKKTFDDLRIHFNKYGGSIGKSEKYALPQTHDARKLVKMGKDTWKAKIKPMLDRQAMTNDTGKILNDSELDEALEYVFESITTGGLNKIKGLQVTGLGKKLSKRHSEKRFLHFKSADDWIAYNEELGSSDAFTTITGHIDMMSHDIALMKIFGTNPNQTYKALRLQAQKEGASAAGLLKADNTWNVTSGKVAGGEMLGLADVSQTASNVVTSAYLGSAIISAFADLGFQAVTAHYRGISSLKIINRQLKMSATQGDTLFAMRLGLGAESAVNRAHSANRWADIYGVGRSAKTAEFVIRASGLEAWTEAGRHAFGMEMSAFLFDQFQKPYGKLDKKTVRMFEEYGIDSKDWDTFRANKPMMQGGAPYADFTAEGSEKFRQMVFSEMDFAVPTPDNRVRGFTTAGLERGTIKGQAWRSIMNMKSFPITLLTTHVTRMMVQQTLQSKLAYGTALFGTTTILGGLVIQAKDVIAGREPRGMDKDGNSLIDGDFLKAAAMQGGGIPLLGDFLFSDQNRFGGSFAETIAGPKVGLVDDVILDYMVGNIQELTDGEETGFAGETVQLAKQLQPKIWQTKMIQNSFMDWLETQADPKAEQKFRRRERKRQKEYDQERWFTPSADLPLR